MKLDREITIDTAIRIVFENGNYDAPLWEIETEKGFIRWDCD